MILAVPRSPVLKSFLIADTVIQDRASGKWSVVGIFDRVLAPSFPTVHPMVAIYLKMADVEGKHRIRVEFKDAEDRCVGRFEGVEVDVKEGTQTVEMGLPTQMLPLTKPGRYQFQLFVNDEYVGSADLTAVTLKTPPATRP
jgi:hypothetical protein